MNQDTLIQALATHLDPETVIEAQRNGTMFSYYVTLAQKILGNNAQNQTARRQPNRQVIETVCDLNQETTNETEQPTRQNNRTATTRQPATAATRANTTGDRVAVRRL